jgi:hypothetical protein
MAVDPTLTRTYAACMEQLKWRTDVVRSVASGALAVPGSPDLAAELASLQLRKILELIAFGSLTANRDKYAGAYSNFASHWNAKRLLESLDRIHPHFYPRPIRLDRTDAAGIKHFEDIKEGYLTRENFVLLYDATSEVLHTRNPFRGGDPTIQFKHTLQEWVGQIQALLSMHYLQLVDSSDLWVVVMHDARDGKVHVLPAAPRG